MMFDDQRPRLDKWADVILGDSEANSYVDGIGVHWYMSVYDTMAWLFRPWHNLRETHTKYPDKFILATEACAGYLPWELSPVIGDWFRGEAYGYDIMRDLLLGAVGWTDWNLILDM
jgi:glucosylceramidase